MCIIKKIGGLFMFKSKYVESVFNEFKNKNKGQIEYINAAQEILESLD